MTRLGFWRVVADRLAADEPVFVALVVANTRGSPGTLGARLLCDRHGAVEGTIGGGIMEANLLAAATDALEQKSYRPRIQRLVHRKNGESQASGLICAGEQTNLTAVLRGPAQAAAIARFVDALAHQDERSATLSIDPDGLDVTDTGPDPALPPLRLQHDGGDWCYAEENVSRRRLAIVGGGHCGQALARLGLTVGYRIDVFDTRAGLLDANDWPDEVRRHALADYAELAVRLERPELTRVVVMTTAVTQDIEALAAIASKDCRWLGVMGSRSKIRVIRTALRERDIDKTAIDAVHGPIGFDMKSDTPPEIAVSIMGQLLAHEQNPASQQRVGSSSVPDPT